jgi:hypothetical protein
MWKLADRIGLEPLLVRFVAFDFRQSRKAMAPQAAMQRGARKGRDRRRMEAIVQRQERLPAKGNMMASSSTDNTEAFCIRRAGRKIADRTAFLPLGHGLLIDPVAFGKRPQALLTILYRSTDRPCLLALP